MRWTQHQFCIGMATDAIIGCITQSGSTNNPDQEEWIDLLIGKGLDYYS